MYKGNFIIHHYNERVAILQRFLKEIKKNKRKNNRTLFKMF